MSEEVKEQGIQEVVTEAAQQRPPIKWAYIVSTTPRVVLSVGKKKTAIARAVIKPGIGRVRVNGYPIEIWPIEMARWKMMEPLLLAGSIAKQVDIDVNVSGGGGMGQAVAVRQAIARGLVAWSESRELYELYMKYDPYMIKGDPRRTEPKKPGIKHARSKKQKAYR